MIRSLYEQMTSGPSASTSSGMSLMWSDRNVITEALTTEIQAGVSHMLYRFVGLSEAELIHHPLLRTYTTSWCQRMGLGNEQLPGVIPLVAWVVARRVNQMYGITTVPPQLPSPSPHPMSLDLVVSSAQPIPEEDAIETMLSLEAPVDPIATTEVVVLSVEPEPLPSTPPIADVPVVPAEKPKKKTTKPKKEIPTKEIPAKPKKPTTKPITGHKRTRSASSTTQKTSVVPISLSADDSTVAVAVTDPTAPTNKKKLPIPKKLKKEKKPVSTDSVDTPMLSATDSDIPLPTEQPPLHPIVTVYV